MNFPITHIIEADSLTNTCLEFSSDEIVALEMK